MRVGGENDNSDGSKPSRLSHEGGELLLSGSSAQGGDGRDNGGGGGDGRKKGGGRGESKERDWRCLECREWNREWRSFCRKCEAPRIGRATTLLRTEEEEEEEEMEWETTTTSPPKCSECRRPRTEAGT